ncbi:MAG TPA: penicillin-binding protein 2 [Acidimicrobiales bacterium]|nr:penicillin-binding protein 2 [Acidimicrobiales bacterium]
MRVRRRHFARALRTADTPRRPPVLRPAVDRWRRTRRARWLSRPLATADVGRRPARPPGPRPGRLRQRLRGGRMYPKPRAKPKKTRPSEPRGPRMRPRRSVVDRVMSASEPSAPRTVIRLRVLGLAVLALFALMFIRLWYLQVLDTSSYSQTVTANQVRDVEVPAARGLVLDRTDNIMVGDQVTRDITLSRVSAQQHPAVIGELATLLGMPSSQIEADLSNVQYSPYKPVPIMENAPIEDVLYIGEHASMFPGVASVADTTRAYPMGQTGVQMLGYVGQISSGQLQSHQAQGYQLGDLYGQSGLEDQYEAALRGQPGIQRVEVNAHGQVVGSLGETPPTSGADLVTNIDAGLQQTLQQALDAEIHSLHGASHEGAAVALDPQTGAVLALVSTPTYDPTWWNNGISTAHYHQIQASGALNNNAIQGLFTPGSTFKLATATAALQTGLISPGYVYNDTGAYQIPGCATGGSGCAVYHDNEGEAAGYVNVSRALTVSSDIFFYNLGVQFWQQQGRFGKTPIQEAANALGYGDVTGIDLPNETHLGRVDSPSVVAREHAQDPKDYPNAGWFTGNNLELAFGQGGTVITPLEQAVAYATFANGGTRYAPEIAAGMVTAQGKVVRTVSPKVEGRISLSGSTYQAMLQGFEGVVDDPKGTAYGAFQGFPLSTFPLAGKTGTATTNEQQPNSWFIGWGPLPNPQYLIAVVVQGGGYGAVAAAPVVRQGFDYLVAHPETLTRLAPPSAAPAQAAGPQGGGTTASGGGGTSKANANGTSGNGTAPGPGTTASGGYPTIASPPAQAGAAGRRPRGGPL